MSYQLIGPLLCACVVLVGCPDPKALQSPDAGVDPALLYPNGCDPIVSGACGYPFPSDVWTVPDSRSATGLHLEIPPAIVPTTTVGTTDTTIFRAHDGFSASGPMMTYLEGATSVGLPDSQHIEASLAPDSPTVVIVAETGERVPHWAELDMHSAKPESNGVILIHPAVRLRDATRYIVAIRHVRDGAGDVLPPTRAFKRLRDGEALGDPTFGTRRETYARIVARLAESGVEKDDLQIAWELTTASDVTNTARLLTMRDEALARFGASHAPYEISRIAYDIDSAIAIRIEGTIEVPNYLEASNIISVDASGMPLVQGDAKAPFVLEIPYSAAASGCPVLQYGHSSYPGSSNLDATLRAFANNECFVLFAMDWPGYRDQDANIAYYILTGGDLARFRMLPDMNQQGVLNHIVGLRTVLRGLIHDPATHLEGRTTVLDTAPTYFGLSQGGILGGTYLALSPDLHRGVLAAVGAPYVQMVPRSVAYTVFLAYWHGVYAAPRQYPLLLSLMQLMWDRVDPASYSHRIRVNLFPDTPAHEVLIINALGDAAAPTISGQWMARNIGAENVMPGVRPVFGVAGRTAPFSGGAGLLEIGFDTPTEPVGNLPPPYLPGRHVDSWKSPPILETMARFLHDGTIVNACDGACDPD